MILFLALVLLPCAATARDYQPKTPSIAGAVCVERIADEGALNLYPVNLWLGIGWRDVSFDSGGMAACFHLMPGRHRMHLQWNKGDWRRPRGNGASNTILESAPVDVVLEAGTRAEFEICSKRDPDPRWLLRRRGARVGCADERPR